MNFTLKSRQSTVKHEVESRFWRPPDNFCRKNTGFSVDFRFLVIKTRKTRLFYRFGRQNLAKHWKNTGFWTILTDFRHRFARIPCFVNHIVSSTSRGSVLHANVERHASDINASVSLWVRSVLHANVERHASDINASVSLWVRKLST
jgi:hypothetical protein